MSTTEDELRRENARLWEENNRLRAAAAEEAYHQQLSAQMESSLSWQVTAPLRAAKTLAVKIRRRLDES